MFHQQAVGALEVAMCPVYLAKQNNKGKSYSLVVETCLAVLSTGTWCVDTGAANHICNSLQEFHQTRQFSDREIYILGGDNTSVSSCSRRY